MFKMVLGLIFVAGSMSLGSSAKAYTCSDVLFSGGDSYSKYFLKLISETSKKKFGARVKDAYAGMKFRKSEEAIFFKFNELDVLASYSIKHIRSLTASQLNALIEIFRQSALNSKDFYDIPEDFAREWDYEVSQRWLDQTVDNPDPREGFNFSVSMAFHAAFNRSTFKTPLVDEFFVQSLINFLSLRTEEGYLQISTFNMTDLKRLNSIFLLYPEVKQSDEFRNDIAMGLGFSSSGISSLEGYDSPIENSGVEIPFLGQEALENFEYEDDRTRLRGNEWYQ